MPAFYITVITLCFIIVFMLGAFQRYKDIYVAQWSGVILEKHEGTSSFGGGLSTSRYVVIRSDETGKKSSVRGLSRRFFERLEPGDHLTKGHYSSQVEVYRPDGTTFTSFD